MSAADDYAIRQERMDEEYRAAWEKATPTQRAAMAQAGVKGPDLGEIHRPTNCRDDDAATLFENSMRTATWDAAPESVPDWLSETYGISAEAAEGIALWHAEAVKTEVKKETSLQLNRVIGFFMMPGNLLVRAHALAHASRMAAISGLRSLRHSAEVCGVSVEAVRKVAWKWVEMLGMPPLEGAKSPAACKAYSEDKKTNHWRKQTYEK